VHSTITSQEEQHQRQIRCWRHSQSRSACCDSCEIPVACQCRSRPPERLSPPGSSTWSCELRRPLLPLLPSAHSSEGTAEGTAAAWGCKQPPPSTYSTCQLAVELPAVTARGSSDGKGVQGALLVQHQVGHQELFTMHLQFTEESQLA